MGRCSRKFTESLAGERQGLTIAFSFRLKPCDQQGASDLKRERP